MNETKKEKSIRLILIVFFILVTMFAFIIRNHNQPVKSYKYQPIALVIKQSADGTDDPVVALYEFKNSEHVLAFFKVERNNNYKFKTLHAIKLKGAPDQLLPDRGEKGVWVHLGNKWQYFSERLEIKSRDTQFKKSKSPYEATFKIIEEASKVLINNNHTISLKNSSNPPTGIYSLSKDDSLWLIITKKNVGIGLVETK
ncbi:hypothetical protein [Bacillus sp. S/N-304-OC-R1]|uniref:hypothetical protein n=1 Tax=Bacillus sp. S/N-304-OC-R1 TaxID=2758034 RepID=UPI001C8E7E20|nr:hypothetical protein [Bacillus sp. S/N-304-OC-R1]MBY0124111.1 hypothetical protein [Bacillus sp. S/N-304-OC-R1]